jgi:hypothetical protein
MRQVFPRRDDGLIAVKAAAVEELRDVLGTTIRVDYTDARRDGRIIHLPGGFTANDADYVIIVPQSRTVLEVVDFLKFQEKYSENGL